MYRKLFSLLVCILVISRAKAQQDVQFSQYIFNGLAINPAYAGYKEDWYVQALYRQQWSGFPGSPKTGGVSADGLLNVPDNQIGIGVQMLWEKLGPQQAASFFGNYAYRIRIDQEDSKRLCLGIGAGATSYSLDGTMLDPTDGNDRSLPVGKINSWVPDAKFGIYYYTPSWYAGLSAMDLFAVRENRSIYSSSGHDYVSLRKAAHLYLTAGTFFSLSEQIQMKPSFLWKEDFKGPSLLDLNIFFLFADKLWLGGSYRTSMALGKKALQPGLAVNTAASVMMEVYATENLRIGYSYDFVTNGLAGYQKGSHEISVGLLLPSKKRNELIYNPRYFRDQPRGSKMF